MEQGHPGQYQGGGQELARHPEQVGRVKQKRIKTEGT